ncbi:hypothetical protein RJT30_01405 [Buchnera aphidicola (Mollitrichosiphum nigrofasciatum)]|uniref:CAF17-like 4Fe-4S cluster assembly/insertion protein YgfZ n=1 Tax=Buchnera aphidicola TaxID=9 RepID=UPI0031B807D7
MKKYLQNNISYYDINKLPIALFNLKKWVFVTISGIDAAKYLNNKFTMNINLLNFKKYFHCANCDIYGKVLSNFLIFKYNNNYGYVIRKSILKIQKKEFKKYLNFYKIYTQRKKEFLLFGVSGTNLRLFLLKFFKLLPDYHNTIVNYGDIIILQFQYPEERFLFIVKFSQVLFFKNIFRNFSVFYDDQWSILHLKSGIPILDRINSKIFLPQSVNLRIPDNIDIYKGCYIGQEIISKVFFKKINRKYLYVLELLTKNFTYNFENCVIRFTDMYKNYIIGRILFTVKLNNKIFWLQIVLNKNLPLNTILLFENICPVYFKVKYKFYV